MADLIIFTNNFPFGIGETFLETEIVYLSNSFNTISLFPLYNGGNKNVRELPQNVEYFSPFIPYNIKTGRYKLLFNGIFNRGPIYFVLKEFYKKRIFKSIGHFKNWLATSCIMRILLSPKSRMIIDSQIDKNSVLYFYWGDKSSGIVPYLSKRYRNSIIGRFHNSDLYEEIKDGYIPFREDLLKHITTSVFIAKKGEEYLLEKYPNLKFNCKVFRLGVQGVGISEASQDDVLRIVSCSYLVPIKRISLLMEALNILDFDVEWTHLGGGILLEELLDKSKGLKQNVKSDFLGQMSNQEVLQFYLNNPVDLFINVSESEGIPVSIMEAISFGIPIIATDVGGTSEIINSKFGKLLPKSLKAFELTKEIEKFHHKKIEEKESMRKEARDYWFRNYNADKNYPEFAEYINRLR